MGKVGEPFVGIGVVNVMTRKVVPVKHLRDPGQDEDEKESETLFRHKIEPEPSDDLFPGSCFKKCKNRHKKDVGRADQDGQGKDKTEQKPHPERTFTSFLHSLHQVQCK